MGIVNDPKLFCKFNKSPLFEAYAKSARLKCTYLKRSIRTIITTEYAGEHSSNRIHYSKEATYALSLFVGDLRDPKHSRRICEVGVSLARYISGEEYSYIGAHLVPKVFAAAGKEVSVEKVPMLLDIYTIMDPPFVRDFMRWRMENGV